MSSLSRELVFLLLQFLEEEKFKESVHELEKESGVYFNMKYFEDKVQTGEWEEVENYLSGYTKVDDNRYSMKMFFEIRKQKYLEALDWNDKVKAVEILVSDLKVFSTFNEELYKEIMQLLTLTNFRENEKLSNYGDTKAARSIMLIELKKLIEANPLFRDKLVFPTLKSSRLRTLINQSLNWQHKLCKNPRPNPDIKTLFMDHTCSRPNSPLAPTPVNLPVAKLYAPLGAHSSASERAALTSKEDLISRHLKYGNKDLRHSGRSFDRSRPISPATPPQILTSSLPSEIVLSEDRLRGLSLMTIQEFYSARDEKEVALCIKELNSPAFHPTMIRLWVTDAFERTDLERDLLTKLLVNLSRSNDGTLNQAHLVKGFEAVLATLEDTVNDTPRAPEYLGRILAKVITESMVSLREVGDLIYQGGEEPGALLQAGLAADVLGNVLKAIRTEKGEGFLNDMRTNSNLRLDSFLPPDPMKSRVLEEFI